MRTFETDELTILDIASYLATQSPIELEVYTIALARIPSAFLGEPQMGVLRRPGVLWVERGRHERVEATIRDRMLRDSEYPQILRSRFEAACASLRLTLAETAITTRSLAAVWDGLGDVMPFMAFNWLLPREELAGQLSALAGLEPAEAEEWLVASAIPSKPPHFVHFRQQLLLLARAHLRDEPVDCAGFARTLGKLQNSLIDAAPLENPAAVAEHVAELADELEDDAGVDAELARLDRARLEALERRTAWIELTRGRAPSADHARIDAIAELVQLAADEEEERHVLQMQALTVLRLAAEERGVPTAGSTSAELGLPQLLPARPRAA